MGGKVNREAGFPVPVAPIMNTTFLLLNLILLTKGVDITQNATAINEVLELSIVPNAKFEAKLREMDLEWLRDTLVERTCWDQVYWATAEGITSMDCSPDAKRLLHLLTRRIRPLGNRTDVTFPRALVAVCAIQGILLNMGAQIILLWKMFYRGNKKAFLLSGLITALCKWAGVPLFDADEVLLMEPPFHPLLVIQGSTSRSKKRRTGRASSSKAAMDSNDEDPLSGARIKEDLQAVRKRMGNAYAGFNLVPPSTALEVEMLRRQLRQERKKNIARDCLMIRLWKGFVRIPSRVLSGSFRKNRGGRLRFCLASSRFGGENPALAVPPWRN
uniref:Putative plant transposon protein domain-containing protein n=1 Tax=Solanum tuberosum TaxID=4113 RepID=M1DK41_SOLTU